MYLIQIFLPLCDNRRKRIARARYDAVRGELTERFGGLTGYTRAPAEGLWKEGAAGMTRDDLVIYEVMAKTLEKGWWRRYRRALEKRFRQKQLVVRAQKVRLL